MPQRDWLVDAEAATIGTALKNLLASLRKLPVTERIQPLNDIRRALHEISPFSAEPVDCVIWVPSEQLRANDYNPNTVAPPEMQLLAHSISEDGYTQPIVSWTNGDGFEVVDGFHRHRVGRENPEIRKRVRGHLPLTVVNADRVDRGDRIAATIRHNRARGKHQVEAMSDIVMELRRRNWSPEKIGKELGMDPDEVLRLTQITGMAELFSNEEFSKSWSLDAVEEPADAGLAELES
jgi:ParB-like chromosome segregation protein Spo0J